MKKREEQIVWNTFGSFSSKIRSYINVRKYICIYIYIPYVNILRKRNFFFFRKTTVAIIPRPYTRAWNTAEKCISWQTIIFAMKIRSTNKWNWKKKPLCFCLFCVHENVRLLDRYLSSQKNFSSCPVGTFETPRPAEHCYARCALVFETRARLVLP